MSLRLLQVAVGLLIVVGLASVAVIALSITDLYARNAALTHDLCVTTVRQQHEIEAIAAAAHVRLPSHKPLPEC